MKRFLILALFVVFLAGCVAPAQRPVAEPKLDKHPKPFDASMAVWKANHGSTAKGQEEKCFTCHKPEKFCNKCHSFVGGAPIFEAQAASQPAAEEKPAEEKPAQAPEAQPAVHGAGTCDSCHDAPTMDDMRAGLHANAFRKQPDIHKGLCKNCHNVAEQCSKCHSVPEVVEQ